MRISDFTETHGPTTQPGAADAAGEIDDAAHLASDEEEITSGPLMPLVLAGLVAYMTYRAGWGSLVVLVGFVFMIFMHELGHFLTARASGMKVTQFFLGFGPKLWSVQHGETEYGLKAIPAGAYVRIIGMNNLDPVEPGDEDRAFRVMPYWRRMMVVLAGSGMHFAMAFVALLIMHGVVGWTGPSEPQERWNVAAVVPDSSAEAIGLQAGDEIVAVAGHSITDFGELVGVITDSANQPVDFRVLRNGDEIALSGVVGAQVEDPSLGYLGVMRGTVEPPAQALGGTIESSVKDFGEFATGSIDGILNLPWLLARSTGLTSDEPVAIDGTGDDGSDRGDGALIGPIGMVRIGDEIVEDQGWTSLGGLFIAVNVFVGVFNLVPLLPFDGGHAVVATYERLRSFGKRRHYADVAKLLPLTYATFAVIVVLMALTVYSDVFKLDELFG